MSFRRCLLAAVLSVALFYLYVLGVTLIPDVSEEYRDYYITRESGLSPMERKRMGAVAPGDVLAFDDPKIGFDSWSGAEEGFRWSLGARPQLHFLLRDEEDAAGIDALVLQVRPMGEQRVRVFLNGEALGEHHLSSSQGVALSIPVAETLLHEGENILSLELPDARRPGNGDPRELGLAFISLHLSRV